ncbi:hypothetical protein C0993_005771 [Termitomyces sp. T159_Od127]|nr:hypothetical protein C0993_005771 [Termitomyces sp. T159_Od127]
MAENLFSDSYAFSPVYTDNTLAQPVSAGEPSDFSSHYRARVDLLRRPNEQVGTSSTPALPWGATAGSTWDQARFGQEKIHRHQQLRQYIPNDISTPYRHSIQRPKYEFEADLDFSDGSTSSIPSSTGSEIHLPLPAASAQVTEAFSSSRATFSPSTLIEPTTSQFSPQVSFNPSSSFHSHSQPTPATLHNRKDFIDESAFGALSIDDPTLLTTNAPSFFADVASIGSGVHRAVLADPDDTPMPPRPSSTTEGDADLWRAFMRSTPVSEQPHHQPHHQLPSRRASLPAFNVGHAGGAFHPPAYAQDRRSSSSQFPFHEPRYTQQSDDLLRYRQAVLARALETETVLRPPPSKPRLSVVDTAHGPGPGPGRLIPFSTAARRRVSRPGSSESSGSSGTSASSVVGAAREEREEKQEAGRPRMKRELSNTTRGEPESKRRVVGGDSCEGRIG